MRNLGCGLRNEDMAFVFTFFFEISTTKTALMRRVTGSMAFVFTFFWRSYLKMALKNDFFYFFQPLCFWKAETKLEMDLLEFLGSEVI